MIQFVVGSYASKDEKGLSIIQFDATSFDLQTIVSAQNIEYPSFVAVDATRDFIFAVSEKAKGEVVSYRYARETGMIEEWSRQSTEGADPCYIQLHRSGRWLLGANYSGGSIFVHPISDDGSIGPISQFVQHEGHSVREDRQTSAHPHSIWNLPGTDYFIVPDLGTDTLYTYAFDATVGTLTRISEVAATPGAGPRHIAFHPTAHVLYVMNELSSTIGVFSFDVETGHLTRLQSDVPVLPTDVNAVTSTAADIHLSADSRHVYASNRGHDSIATLKVLENGRLEGLSDGALTTVSTQGKTPRNFAVTSDDSGHEYVFVANQDSDNIVVFSAVDGVLKPVGDAYRTTKPVCLARLR